MRVDLTAQAAHQHVWRPDAFGSVCFLVASALAWFEVCHGWAAWRPRSWSWWITLLNLVGSVAFGVSAVAGYINPATGQLHNAERSNLGTFIGAVCFLAGALLLLPERTEESKSPSRPPPAVSPDLDDIGRPRQAAGAEAKRLSPSASERYLVIRWPRTLLPASSSGGENVPMLPLPGDTVTMPPADSAFAGEAYVVQPLARMLVEPGRGQDGQDSLAVSVSMACSPVTGFRPPFASVAPMAARSRALTRSEHWRV